MLKEKRHDPGCKGAAFFAPLTVERRPATEGEQCENMPHKLAPSPAQLGTLPPTPERSQTIVQFWNAGPSNRLGKRQILFGVGECREPSKFRAGPERSESMRC